MAESIEHMNEEDLRKALFSTVDNPAIHQGESLGQGLKRVSSLVREHISEKAADKIDRLIPGIIAEEEGDQTTHASYWLILVFLRLCRLFF